MGPESSGRRAYAFALPAFVGLAMIVWLASPSRIGAGPVLQAGQHVSEVSAVEPASLRSIPDGFDPASPNSSNSSGNAELVADSSAVLRIETDPRWERWLQQRQIDGGRGAAAQLLPFLCARAAEVLEAEGERMSLAAGEGLFLQALQSEEMKVVFRNTPEGRGICLPTRDRFPVLFDLSDAIREAPPGAGATVPDNLWSPAEALVLAAIRARP
ncbi:MAG TPA: hypothetical protein VJP77_08930 [Planctomycetota bacterium]|nr:hypothetical protein [Planctomycetota bacterium]